MLENERPTIAKVQEQLAAFGERIVPAGGEVVKTMGDGLVALFPNAHDAIATAVAFQAELAEGSRGAGPIYRIGIHMGDVFRVGTDVGGHAVNLASRLQAAADPGTVLVSEAVRQAAQGSAEFAFTYQGTPYLKNIGDFIKVYTVRSAAAPTPSRWQLLNVVGPIRVTSSAGAPIDVPDAAKALLAVVAVAGRAGPVTEAFVRDLLFEDDEPEARTRGLDAALADIAAAFEPHGAAGPVARANDALALDPNIIDCDLFHADRDAAREAQFARDLCEGFDWGGPRFRGWLLRQRSLMRSGTVLRISETLFGDHDVSGFMRPRLFCVGLVAGSEGGSQHERFLADVIADVIMRSLLETEALHVLDLRHPTPAEDNAALAGPDILVRCDVRADRGMTRVCTSGLRPEDGTVLCSETFVGKDRALLSQHDDDLAVFVSRVTDGILSTLIAGRHIKDEAAHLAAKTALRAVHHLLTLSNTGLDRLEAELARAYEFDPKPIYLAWLAYLTTFAVGERHGEADPALAERARELSRRALETGPRNGTVLGLVGHVHSYVLRDFAGAEDCLSLALEMSPFRAICWDSASLLYSYTGRSELALSAATMARKIGRHGPYRHLFDGACCVASFVNGRYEDAVRFGESVRAVQPDFKANLRYLAAAYGMMGDRASGEPRLLRMRELEPDLTLGRLKDRAYPMPSQTTADLVARGLRELGLTE